ncbi:TonB-dependent receptor plug domain-containing protein [Marinospirillum sp.]|uniref:TonB-dependent receptor plug domain-containing protein n=1 Tax=Marinospirillum sp. TaxID=2183934 RepID=UPI00384F96FB
MVTAQRISQPLSQTLAATSVITRADIDRLQPSTLVDLLQGQAGIEIGRTGGKMATTGVFMRGAESRHTLVLVDGQKINDLAFGGASLQFIPVSQIERVEIVRGPQSSAWGADALGGVINIITRKEHDQPYAGYLRERIGRYQTYSLDGDLRVGNEATRFNLGLHLEESEGFNAQTADTTGEEDGYEHYSINLGLEQDLGEQHQLGFRVLHNRGESEYDGFGGTPADSHQEFEVTTLQAGWEAELNQNWDMLVNVGRNEEKREDFADGNENFSAKFRRDNLQLEHQFNYEDYSAAVGADVSQEKLLEVDDYDKTQRDAYGIFAQGNFQFLDKLNLSLGSRYDDDEFFGSQATGNLALAWDWSEDTQVGASAAQGYLAPRIGQLFGPFGANPDLEPEESVNYEAWVAYNNQLGSRARVSVFNNEIDNLIAWKNSTNVNINEVRIRGLEFDAQYRLNDWRFGASLTLQDPENTETGDQLARRAKQHGKVDVDYLAEKWSLGGSIQGQGERPDGSEDLPGYAVLNLRGHYAFNENWRLDGKVDNLLDEEYELASGYNTAGIYPEVSLRFDF